LAVQTSEDRGFSIVEVIIAMFLLGLIAVALLPALWQGIQYSSQQSAVATATRQLNAMIEQARDNPTCTQLTSLGTPSVVQDGAGGAITISGVVGACPSASKTVSLSLTAVNSGNKTLASASAIVFVP
jgi:prepilin-type N-terminal cleavage/methylation domain-containing protein